MKLDMIKMEMLLVEKKKPQKVQTQVKTMKQKKPLNNPRDHQTLMDSYPQVKTISKKANLSKEWYLPWQEVSFLLSSPSTSVVWEVETEMIT